MLAQGILKYPGKLTGSIWYEVLFLIRVLEFAVWGLRKALYDVAQGAQTCVDVLGFLESQTFGGGSAYPLRSCQVHQHKSCLHLLDLVGLVFSLIGALTCLRLPCLIHIDVKNGMTPA